MSGITRQPVLVVYIVVLVVTVTALTISGCAAQSAQGPLVYAPTMTAPVLVLYNQGAAAFQKGDLPKAQEKYQAALEKARALGDEQGIGASLAGLGAVYQALQDYPKALEFFSAAVPYFKRTNNLAAEGWALAAIGEVHAQMGDDTNAIKSFDQALAIGEQVLAKASEQEKISILLVRANVLGHKAVAHQNLKQFSEAVEIYRRAAVDFQLVGNREMAGRALWSAGTVTRSKMKNPRQAVELLSEAWPLLQDVGKVEISIWVRLEIGVSYKESGKFKEAAAAFTEAIKAAEREGLSKLVAHGYSGLGLAFESQGEFEVALTHYESALQSLRKSDQKPDPSHEAEFLYLKGGIYQVRSQYDDAIEHFRAAVSKYREAKVSEGEAAALTRLAEISLWVADYKAATRYYKRALELYKVAADIPKQITILAALAEAAWLGEETPSDEVSNYLHEGKRLLDSIRTEVGFDPVAPLGDAQTKTDQKFLREARRLVREWREKIPALSPEELYAVAYVGFMIKESKNIFHEWQEKVPSLGSDYLTAVGTLHQKSGIMALWSGGGDPALAASYFRLAGLYHTGMPFNRDLGIEWAKDWFYSGESYRRQGKFDLARLVFDQAKMLAILLRSPEVHWVYAGLARTYWDMGDTEKALAHYRTALKMLESVQGQQGIEEIKIGVLERALDIYRPFVTLLLDLYAKNGEARYLHEAFNYNERLRARAFLDMLGRSRVTRLGGEVGSLAEKEEEIRRQIARIHRQLRAPHLDKAEETQLLDQLENLRERWRTLQQQAAQQSQRYAQLVFPRPVTLEEVQSVLDPDAVLLEYSIDTKASTLWAITKDQVQAYRLPGSKKLPILEQYLKSLREPLMGEDEVSRHMALGRMLYWELMRPAERQIRGKTHLIIAPDGPLYYLPFEALIISDSRDGGSGAETLANARYLVKEFRVTYVPSASVFVTQRKKLDTQVATGQFPLLAFGDPVYREADSTVGSDMQTRRITHQILRGSSLSRLEFSAQEVRRIARIWDIPLDSAHINLRDRATVERLRKLDLSRYRMLHFATHGVLGDEVGLTTQPALVLSQIGDKDGGLLQFADILDLKLNADLVVLSACSTGLGRLREGEGIVGLTRAFMYAGASSVVVSLWKVEDQSTSLLMERFYQRLKQGESKSEALQQAKLDVLHTTIELKAIGMHQALASPFYWAPFILVGEAR